MANCLVLGGNGFIGSHVADALANSGHTVRSFDRYTTSEPANLNHAHPDIEIFRGDFLNKSSLEASLEDMEYVFHFISTTTPLTAENDPLIDIETNIRMSVELFQLCALRGIKKVVFASTGGAIYGDVDTSEPIGEHIHPKPVSPYAIGKLSVENYLRYFKKKFDLQYRVLRISNPYGPRQNTLTGQGVIPIFLDKVAHDQPLTIYGDGSMIRDYIYVGDVAEMTSQSFVQDSSQETYNIGSGSGHSVNDLVDVIRRVTGRSIKLEHKPKPVTFVEKIVLDPRRFTEDFGIRPQVDFEEGVRRTWQAMTANP